MGNGITSQVWHDMESTLRVGLKSTVAKNAASLYVIQFAQYILPLITVPYLVRALEPSGYGLVAFGQSFIAYFTILADYGFAFSATRKISLQREDILAVSRTASHVWAAKAVLAAAGFILLLMLTSVVPKLQESSALLLILYGSVIGSVLFPTWLFQGMERMVAISGINLAMQLFILIGVFTFIHRPEDYLIYAALISAGSILSGVVGACVALFMFRIRPVLPSGRGILETLKEGWVLFLSMASVSLYTAGNAFILGLLASPAAVGYYSAAEKIIAAFRRCFVPIGLAVYPKFSKLSFESKTQAIEWGQRLTIFLGSIGMILTLLVIGSASLITSILLGSDFNPSILVIQILAIWIFIDAVTNVWGIQLMLTLNYDRAFFLILFVAGIINIVLALLIVPLWNEAGMAISVILACIFVTIAQYIFLKMNGINVLNMERSRNEQESTL